jgi:hypothetical protein
MLANQEQNQKPTPILAGRAEQYDGDDDVLLQNVSEAFVKDRVAARRLEKACGLPASALLDRKAQFSVKRIVASIEAISEGAAHQRKDGQ